MALEPQSNRRTFLALLASIPLVGPIVNQFERPLEIKTIEIEPSPSWQEPPQVFDEAHLPIEIYFADGVVLSGLATRETMQELMDYAKGLKRYLILRGHTSTRLYEHEPTID